MYGLFIIAIASVAMAVLFGLIGLVLWGLLIKARSKRDEAYENRYEDNYESYHKYNKKTEILENCTDVCWGMVICFVMVALALSIGGAIVLRNAEYEYETFLATQDVFDQVYKEENQFENIMLTQEMLDRNEWLVKAKAAKKTYGRFSRYYYLDLDALKPIGTRA